MGRHAASDKSTVSPPRSNLRTLRDFAEGSTHPGGIASHAAVVSGSDLVTADLVTADLVTADLVTADLVTADLVTADLVTADLVTADLVTADLVTHRLDDGVASSAAPGNRPAVHNRGTDNPVSTSRLTNGSTAGNRATLDPATAISAADLIARFRESGLLTATDRTRRPQPAVVPPVAVQRVKTPTGPIRVADLVARHPHLLNETRNGHRAGFPRPSESGRVERRAGARSQSLFVRVLPALRPEPTIRVAIRPALTVAAIIAAVGLIESPTLFATSHSTADARPAATAGTTTVADPAAAQAAAIRALEKGPLGGTVATTPAPQRVSRSTRRALGIPAKAAAANHVPLMKPGQTVPGTWIRPSTGRYTSCFCARWGTFHAGIDLASPLGTPIVAVGDGTVIKAGPASGFGNWVVIQHANGDVSIYGHMKYFFVHVGQKVKAGEKIALVGDQGFSTGAHLHFEIHQGGFTGPKINPIPWLKARGIVIGPLSSDG